MGRLNSRDEVIKMKSTRNVFLAAFAALALSLGGTTTIAMAQSVAAPVEGSWIFFLTPPPESGNNPFTALVSFAAGGVWLGTGTNDRIVPVSELHGVWKRIGPLRYGVTAHILAFDPTGHAVGVIETDQVFQLTDKNDLVGVAKVRFCDLKAENCMPLPGTTTITGRRTIVEDLPSF
jgi:hypothetical protein